MVHVKFDPNSISYKDFEINQVGSGEYSVFYGVKPYQRGFGHYQRGTGISDFFRTLWRAMIPLVRTAGQSIGQEALSTGSRILDKVAHGENLKNTMEQETLKGVGNLVDKAAHRNQSGGSVSIKRRKNTQNQFISTKNLIGKTVKLSSPQINKKKKRSDAFGFY
jgi:hypothetical protein